MFNVKKEVEGIKERLGIIEGLLPKGKVEEKKVDPKRYASGEVPMVGDYIAYVGISNPTIEEVISLHPVKFQYTINPEVWNLVTPFRNYNLISRASDREKKAEGKEGKYEEERARAERIDITEIIIIKDAKTFVKKSDIDRLLA